MRMGRPKLKKADAKGVLISIRVQPAEKKAFQAKADEAGASLSKWLRETLLEKIK